MEGFRNKYKHILLKRGGALFSTNTSKSMEIASEILDPIRIKLEVKSKIRSSNIRNASLQ